MQLVVSDSDVIIHMAKLNVLILIKELYGCVHMPEYVESEILRYQYDETSMIEEAIRQGILKVHGTSERRAKELAKRYGIHIGEGHVKELAEKLDASIFLSNASGLLEKLRGDEFRIHPDIINKATDSCKRLKPSTKS